ncbi:putative enzyme [Nitrospira defluvii]|uniref:Enzyme n=2 Tax=Nitrospira defluvii TaxID=330214 RepID=A0ABN7KV07_9BACT|nr:putative enzyme [Nitrospira defluvii]
MRRVIREAYLVKRERFGGCGMRGWTSMLAVLVVIVLQATVGLAADLAAENPRTMRFPTVVFNPPDAERLVLDNGMVVYLLEDHELPLVTINATLKTGSWLDPADKVGLAGMTGAVMRTGGSAGMSPDEVDEELEQLAATISIGFGKESGSASLDVLKKDLKRGLHIFADLLRRPAFEQGRVELAKLQALEGIRRRQDSPGSIVGREFAKLLYGATHPSARETSVRSIESLTREDLIAFHRQTVHPNGIMLGVTGDFEKGEMLALLREAFGDWAKGSVSEVKIPPVAESELKTGVVRFISKDTSQTHLRVGHLTVKETDPDYVAVAIANDILGGSSFRSRLFNDVRTKRGLAYSVGSGLRASVYDEGVWLMRAETKLASTQEVVNRFVANMERMRNEPVTDSELEEAKEAYVNSFVFSFTSASSIVGRLMDLEYDGLPKDWLQQIRDKVVKLTKEDIQRAAKAHFNPERLRILAVGSGEALSKVLASFGEVKEITLAPES